MTKTKTKIITRLYIHVQVINAQTRHPLLLLHPRHHLRALMKAINESTSLFSDGYLIGLDECLGKKRIVGKLPSCNSCCANAF
ncbi:hypothetical protein Hanom_Chr15g01357271 [Helianthus anomalus]